MAWIQADLDALEEAIADGRGAKQISFQDQTVQFNTIAEMLNLRATMKREVDSAATNYRLAVTRKGT